MSKELIAANLARLRHAKGLTQAALADQAGISRGAYSQIEKQKTEPKADTLRQLAKALKVSLKELVSPVPVLSHVRFRSQKKLKSRSSILAAVARRLGDLNSLEALVGDEEPGRPPVELPPGLLQLAPGERPVRAAAFVRERFGLGADEPVRDICGLLGANGYRVILVQTASEGFFGLSVGPEDGGPAIVVNDYERLSVERKIFSAAHELGHLLMHRGAYELEREEENKEEEREADAFASAFLMPRDVFRREWEGTRGLPFVKRVLKVKRMFRVSYGTVLYRLGEPLSPEERRQLRIRFHTEYRRLHGQSLAGHLEPDALGREEFASEPQRAREPDSLSSIDFVDDTLHALVRRALEADEISLSRGAEILDIPLLEMRELCASWSGEP